MNDERGKNEKRWVNKRKKGGERNGVRLVEGELSLGKTGKELRKIGKQRNSE